MIKIVTETGTDLPRSLIEEYDIRFASGKVIFGDDVILSYPDLTADAFYERLKKEDQSPATRDPDDRTFRETYKRILDEDPSAKILSIHVSEALATPLNTARRAAIFFPQADIRVFDTRMVSLAEGLLVYQAARMAKEGKDIDTIIEKLTSMRGQTELYFTVDTLDYLHRGGRVGTLPKLIGDLLNLKPIMRMKGGIALPFDRQRSRERTIDALKKAVTDSGLRGDKLLLGVVHAQCLDEATLLADSLKAELEPSEVIIAEIGPTVGTHAGPGALGVAWIGLSPDGAKPDPAEKKPDTPAN